MAVRVGETLGRMERVLATGDRAEAEAAVAADDAVDAMLVSLTERCYDILCRESPMASDLRFVVSVLRVVEELERMGDLALRVVKLAPDHARLAANPPTFALLVEMAAEVRRLFDLVLLAWSATDLRRAEELIGADGGIDERYARVMAQVVELGGPSAVPTALTTVLAARALERLADHVVIIGERLRYLLTGDSRYLASEVR
jgi:phosphate transport system protein